MTIIETDKNPPPPPPAGHRLGPPIEYVGWGRRAVARIIDLVYANVIVLASGFFFGILLVFLDLYFDTDYTFQVRHLDTTFLLNLLYGFITLTTYTTFCEGLYGSTLGKLIMGIVVLDEDLRPCSFLQALLRGLAMLIDGLIFGAVAAIAMSDSLTKQRLGDRWAKSVVVRVHSVPPGSKRSGVMFLIAFFLGSLLSIFFALLPTISAIEW